MTDKEIYERWSKINVFETLDSDGNAVQMSEEEAMPLALQMNEALDILGNRSDEEKDTYIDVFPLLKKMYLRNKSVIVSEFIDKYIRWKNCEKYMVLYSEILPFEPDWELNTIFCDSYDDIDET